MSKSKVYEVDKIIGMKEEKGTKVFKIHWLGYPSSEDSWEPEHNLLNCQSLIADYVKSVAPATPSPAKAQSNTIVSSDEEEVADTPKRRPRKQTVSRKRVISTAPRDTVIKSTTTKTTTVLQTTSQTTPQTTPGRRRYNFRPSTITKFCISDDESSPAKSLARRDLHAMKEVKEPKQKPSQPSQPTPQPSPEKEQTDVSPRTKERSPSPKWMQLGLLEVFFCFLILAMAGGMLWYYDRYVRDAEK